MKAVQTESVNKVAGEEFVIRRLFHVPQRLLFKAWTEPVSLRRWWGPKGFEWVGGTLDLKPGGRFLYCLRSPEGGEMWGKFVYREILPHSRLVFVSSFSNREGETTQHPASPLWPLEILNTITFTPQDGDTLLEIRGLPLDSSPGQQKFFEQNMNMVEKGFGGTFEQLDAYLSDIANSPVMNSREVVITRIMDAPRDLVYKAWTDPAMVSKWWGPDLFTIPLCDLEVRPGGRIRIDMRAPDGSIYPMNGAYREVSPPTKLIFTSAALDGDGNPMFEILNTVLFEEHGGKTTLVLRAGILTAGPEAAPYLAGMEQGWNQSIERLGKYLSRR